MKQGGLFSPRPPTSLDFTFGKAVKRGGQGAQERRNEEGLIVKTGEDEPPKCSPGPEVAVHRCCLSWLGIHLEMANSPGVATGSQCGQRGMVGKGGGWAGHTP